MTTERKIEILELVIKQLELNLLSIRGICDALDKLHYDNKISSQEFILMVSFIDGNRPSSDNQFKEFTKSPYWRKGGYPMTISYWWINIKDEPRTLQIRIDFLNKLIDTLK